MNHLQEFWRKVRELEAELNAAGPCSYVTSLEIVGGPPGHKSGIVVEVSNLNAAEHVTRGLHRLATAEEISAYKADAELRRLQIKREQMSQNSDGSRTVYVGLPPK